MLDYYTNTISNLVNECVSECKEVEYKTFTTRIHLPKEVSKLEENKLRADGIGAGSLKTLLNRRAREIITAKTGRESEINGDIAFLFNLANNSCEIHINPIFILCRYNKYSRNLSQTRWDKYKSVEDYIVDSARMLYNCSNAYLHGAGREDVDVRMLGNGRLCVIEIENPKKRRIDLKMLEESVRELSNGEVELHALKYVDKDFVKIVKLTAFDKLYDAVVFFEHEISGETVSKICGISEIKQRTPNRVMHRRSDRVRSRKIFYIKAIKNTDGTYNFTIKCEAGTYIKELISGDGGRTVPSFSSIAKCSAECTKLDVIKLFDEYIVDWW